jgi:hypothetical protein
MIPFDVFSRYEADEDTNVAEGCLIIKTQN